MTYRPQVPHVPHYVDEETKTVWIKVDSWMMAQGAPHIVKRCFGPDYKCCLSTLDKINELKQNHEQKESS